MIKYKAVQTRARKKFIIIKHPFVIFLGYVVPGICLEFRISGTNSSATIILPSGRVVVVGCCLFDELQVVGP